MRGRMMGGVVARSVLGLLWLLQVLPLGLQAALGRGLGRLLHALAGSRRRVALRNVELCLPALDLAARHPPLREHFSWLARSLIAPRLLWDASPARLKTLIQVEGDVGFAERSDKHTDDNQGTRAQIHVPILGATY